MNYRFSSHKRRIQRGEKNTSKRTVGSFVRKLEQRVVPFLFVSHCVPATIFCHEWHMYLYVNPALPSVVDYHLRDDHYTKIRYPKGIHLWRRWFTQNIIVFRNVWKIVPSQGAIKNETHTTTGNRTPNPSPMNVIGRAVDVKSNKKKRRTSEIRE